MIETNFTRQRSPALRYVRRSTNLWSDEQVEWWPLKWCVAIWALEPGMSPDLEKKDLCRHNEVKDHEKVIILFYPGGHTRKRQLEGGGSRWRCGQRLEPSSPTPRASWSRQSWEYKEGFSTRAKGGWPAAWFQASRLQNCERMCLFCFKPPRCSNLLEQPQEANASTLLQVELYALFTHSLQQ